MGLQKKILCKDIPETDRTSEKWDKECDRLWNIYCKNGSVSITDMPQSEETETLKELLKRDPHALSDYQGEIPFSEFYEKVVNK